MGQTSIFVDVQHDFYTVVKYYFSFYCLHVAAILTFDTSVLGEDKLRQIYENVRSNFVIIID